jgi:hypothetical protein
VGHPPPRNHIAHPDFRGQGRCDRDMQVAFKIVKQPGRDEVRFQASDVPWFCEDNTDGQLDFNVLSARLVGSLDGR